MLTPDLLTEREKEIFKRGILAGINLYAHYRDGVQYVGTCGHTLKKAQEEIKKEKDEFRYCIIAANLEEI